MDKTKVFNCDCIAGMRQFSDNYFELTICDPPYGIGFDREYLSMSTCKTGFSDNGKQVKAKGYKTGQWDATAPDELYFKELFRISKKQIIWGGNYFSLPPSGGWVVWDKRRPFDFTLSQAELAWVSFTSSIRIFEYRWSGMLQEDMKDKEVRIHPTQKPVALYKWLLKNYAKEGDKILDTHGGSMSSVIACLDMGFPITCYELDPDYYNAGKNRIINHLKQLSAFRPAYDIEFHDHNGISKLRDNAGIGYQEQSNGQNKEPIQRIDGLFHGDAVQKE